MEQLYTVTCKTGDAYDFYFPKINVKGKEIIRYYSLTNLWMDVIIVVDLQYAEKAKMALSEAIEKYWESDDLDAFCYGDFIDMQFKEDGIPYLVVYHDPNDETLQYEEAWNLFIKTLYEQKGEI